MIVLPANLIDTTVLPCVLFFIAVITGVLSFTSLFVLIYGISKKKEKSIRLFGSLYCSAWSLFVG